MGYDCTMHVVDEEVIRGRFVRQLLGELPDGTAFDAQKDAAELWATVRGSLAQLEHGDESPRRAAIMVGQLAIAYAAAELPYHYERGFCLSLWEDDQEPAVAACFPKKFRGQPSDLFAAVIERHPALQGQFPSEIEENFCPGIYVPAEKVPAALKWVERKVNSFAKPDRRLFRGLLLVLKEAAKQGKAYWEGTDLPVPMATMQPPAEERVPGLEEWKNPHDIYMKYLYRDGPTLVFAHGIGFPQDCRTVLLDVSQWPPQTTAVWNEYATCAAKSAEGRWLTVSMTSDFEYMYRARVRDSLGSEPVVLMPPEERKHGLYWAGFLGNRVIAVLGSVEEFPNWEAGNHTGVLTPAYPLWEEGGRLVRRDELLKSPEKFPNTGTVVLRDGASVFIWDTQGFELVDGKFVATFEVPAKWSNYDSSDLVPCGVSGFFCCDSYDRAGGGLYSIQRGANTVRHLPKIMRVRGISRGPGESILVAELGERSDLGKIYFPAEESYVRIAPEMFADEDPSAIHSLHYVEECQRLIAATSERLWAVPIERVLAQPRYNATTGRARGKKGK